MINGQDNALLGAFFDTILQLFNAAAPARARRMAAASPRTNLGPVRENLSHRARSKAA